MTKPSVSARKMETIADQIYIISHIAFWKVFGRPYRSLLHIRCWLTGHQEEIGDWRAGEPAWCSRCGRDDPSETITLPTLLNRGYCWLVEREWSWFDSLDEWLLTRVSRRWWPSWWEY